MNTKDIFVGFDVGTSSLKLIAFNLNSKQIELALTSSTDSARIRNENSTHDEQNVDILIDLIDRLFEKIPSEVFDRIKAVQICGQMHGVVLWNTADCRKIHSNLVTWQGLFEHG